jgi:hypothetical protein
LLAFSAVANVSAVFVFLMVLEFKL